MGRIRGFIARRRRLVISVGILLGLLILGSAVSVLTRPTPVAPPTALTLAGGPVSIDDPRPVQLEADLYLPPGLPEGATASAVLLAHGFGGSKASVAEEAIALAESGFVVLAYSARGFGASTGQISMNAPEFEVADASALLDHLATVPQVTKDGVGDPRVGVAGGSYGGALALMLAGYDERVDAVAADITWNSLESSLFGQSARSTTGLGASPSGASDTLGASPSGASDTLGASPSGASDTLGASPSGASDTLGAYKSLWSGLFFSSGQAPIDRAAGEVTECGRFTPAWCEAYARAAVDGTVTPADAKLMYRSSPASITERITAPTLLGGGQADSLFPLTQVNANAQQISAANPEAPVKVVWHAGGHDGGLASADTVNEQLRALTADWFNAHLNDGPSVSDDFLYAMTEASALSDRAAASFEVLANPDYPGLRGQSSEAITLRGAPQHVVSPAGGVPTAISSVPGLGGIGSLLGQFGGGAVPGIAQQTATFISEPVAQTTAIVGATTASINLSSDRPVAGATVFAALRIVDASGRSSLPAGLVAPVRVDALGPEPTTLDITLPAIVTDAPAGSRLALTVTTTDQAYRLPPGPAVYTVSLADDTIAVPSVAGTPVQSPRPLWLWPLLALGAIVLASLVLLLTRPRRSPASPYADPAMADVPPVVVTGLAKEYSGGVRAVDGVDFTVPTGVVLGLLGPNGAGKSTTMRMMMGLITPSAGEVRVFGEVIRPGSPALARVGCFIEGPGLLPHLTGRQNLDLFWRASGRSGDPRMAEVLEIAGLGSAIDRRVRTYSQGMRQRVGIAQAMLGMPDLLILDEPTNGLDPPQIKEMRDVMRAYATEHRTVIVSSHLLSEVEQTCSDVVVMGAGRVIAQGSVEELLREHEGRRLEDVFLELVGEGHAVTTRGGDS